MNSPGVAVDSNVPMQSIRRVSQLGSTPHVSTSGTAMPRVVRPRSNLKDVYTFKDASSPSCYSRSQLDVHGLHFEAGSVEAGNRHETGGDLSFLAATRSLSTLHIEGSRILSLFHILVFMHRWYLQIPENWYKPILLPHRDGPSWTLIQIEGSPLLRQSLRSGF